LYYASRFGFSFDVSQVKTAQGFRDLRARAEVARADFVASLVSSYGASEIMIASYYSFRPMAGCASPMIFKRQRSLTIAQ